MRPVGAGLDWGFKEEGQVIPGNPRSVRGRPKRQVANLRERGAVTAGELVAPMYSAIHRVLTGESLPLI